MGFAFYLMLLCFTCTLEKKKEGCIVIEKMDNGELVYDQVSRMPFFKKGDSDFLLYLAENVNKTWVSSENQTIVRLEFVVLSNGLIYKAGITGKRRDKYSQVDKSYLRALENMPAWNPGRCEGNNVAVKVRIPIRLDWQ